MVLPSMLAVFPLQSDYHIFSAALRAFLQQLYFYQFRQNNAPVKHGCFLQMSMQVHPYESQ